MQVLFHSRCALFVAVALAGTLVGGCGDSGNSATCERNPALVAQARACSTDDNCPCGAGCVLGLCKAGCSSDADCSTGQCDRFGRCREIGQDPVVPPLARDEQHLLTLSSSFVSLPTPKAAQPLELTVVRGSDTPIRVALGSSEYEARCGQSGDFKKECTFDKAKSAGKPVVWLRAAGGKEPARSGDIRVYYGPALFVASVGTPAIANAVLDNPDQRSSFFAAPVVSTPTPGVYKGTASLTAGGVSDATAPTGRDLGNIYAPITATLFGAAGQGVIAIEDPLRMLTPTGKWIGRFIADAKDKKTGTVTFKTVAFLDGAASAGAPTEVLLKPDPAAYQAGATSFSFSLLTRFTGALMGDRKPFARWQISLGRQGALPTGAKVPAVPDTIVAKLLASRGSTRTAWEDAFAKAATPRLSRFKSAAPAEMRALLETYGRLGNSGTLELCNLDTATADLFAQFATKDGWGVSDPDIGKWIAPLTLTGKKLPIASRLSGALDKQALVRITPTLSSTITVKRDLPCDVTFNAAAVSFTGACGAAVAINFAMGKVDRCAEMAKAYGCNVEALAGQTLTVDADIEIEDAAKCQRRNKAIKITGDVTRVCRMPVVPGSCAEMALCYQPTAPTETPDSVKAPFLATDKQLPVSGDFKCLSGDRAAALAMDLNAELPASDPKRLKVSTLLDECKTELAALRSGAAPKSSADKYAKAISPLLKAAKCIDAARFYYAMGLATDADRRRALTPGDAISPLSSAMANRLLQRWLLQHAFIAREAAETERMAQALRGDVTSGGVKVASAAEQLKASLAGWQIFLHPRFASAIERMPASVLIAPDYRAVIAQKAVASQPHHEQPVALPVTMLQTLNAQMALALARLELAARHQDKTALVTFGELMRIGYLVRGLAAELAVRAEKYAKDQNKPTPAWLALYGRASFQAQALSGRVVALAKALAQGENPLGITDEDTPLYFFGDEKSATRRFSAVSDYLLGSSPASNAWAPKMVERATAALADARKTWLAKRDRHVQVTLAQGDQATRLDKIRSKYGERIAQLCGLKDGVKTNEILEKWPNFTANRCFRRAADNCTVDPNVYGAQMPKEAFEYQLCRVGYMRSKTNKQLMFYDDRLDTIADKVFAKACSAQYPVACAGLRCVKCGSDGEPAPVSPTAFRQLRGLENVPVSVSRTAGDACAARFPGVNRVLPSADALPNSPTTNPKCYSGSLGENVFEIHAAASAVEAARADISKLKQAWSIAMNSCIIQVSGGAKIGELQKKMQHAINALGAVKLGMDIVSAAAATAKECTATLAGIQYVSPASPANAALGGTSCVLGIVEGGANIASLSLGYAMDTVRNDHEKWIADLEGEIDDKQCITNADLHLVGLRSATLRIQRALTDLQKAVYRMEEGKRKAARYYHDGRAALAAAQGRAIAPMAHDLWLDEKIDRFIKDMRIARRVTYLAVRAVEYESQSSMTLRDKVLTASRPSELQDVLDQLWATAATRGVGGNRPTDLKVVLSMRKHLLQLPSILSANEQTMSELERFRLTLCNKKYARHDDKGKYIGQRIPFEIAPLAAIKLGDAKGVPVLASSDCAERVWSVNASVLGTDVQIGKKASFVRIELHKSNTFYSQWCGKAKTLFQLASVRPTRNLFKDPVYGGDLASTLGATSESKLYSRARIEAYLNVDQKALEAEKYASGKTSELAARGLYGAYALVLPAEVMSEKGKDGLVCNKIDDVLLRLDYVSVAR